MLAAALRCQDLAGGTTPRPRAMVSLVPPPGRFFDAHAFRRRDKCGRSGGEPGHEHGFLSGFSVSVLQLPDLWGRSPDRGPSCAPLAQTRARDTILYVTPTSIGRRRQKPSAHNDTDLCQLFPLRTPAALAPNRRRAGWWWCGPPAGISQLRVPGSWASDRPQQRGAPWPCRAPTVPSRPGASTKEMSLEDALCTP